MKNNPMFIAENQAFLCQLVYQPRKEMCLTLPHLSQQWPWICNFKKIDSFRRPLDEHALWLNRRLWMAAAAGGAAMIMFWIIRWTK
jgi:hypothetical protein